jgi:hypothetical protein
MVEKILGFLVLNDSNFDPYRCLMKMKVNSEYIILYVYIYYRAAVFEMDMRSLNNQVFLTLTNFCLLIMLISDFLDI